jgi:hypothetical protein
MSYFVAFLRTREEIPYLFLRTSIDAFFLREDCSCCCNLSYSKIGIVVWIGKLPDG